MRTDVSRIFFKGHSRIKSWTYRDEENSIKFGRFGVRRISKGRSSLSSPLSSSRFTICEAESFPFCLFASLSLHCHLRVASLLAPLFVNHSHHQPRCPAERVLRCEDVSRNLRTSLLVAPPFVTLFTTLTHEIDRVARNHGSREIRENAQRRETHARYTEYTTSRVIVAVQQRACSLGAIFVLGG